MLFLPEGELHEITLLFSSYIVKSRNHKVIYLGQNLPFGDLKEVYGVHQPRFLLSVFTSFPQPDNVQGYIYKLSQAFASSTILLSGYQLVGNEYDYPENVKLLNKLEDLVLFLDALA